MQDDPRVDTVRFEYSPTMNNIWVLFYIFVCDQSSR